MQWHLVSYVPLLSFLVHYTITGRRVVTLRQSKKVPTVHCCRKSAVLHGTIKSSGGGLEPCLRKHLLRSNKNQGHLVVIWASRSLWQNVSIGPVLCIQTSHTHLWRAARVRMMWYKASLPLPPLTGLHRRVLETIKLGWS